MFRATTSQPVIIARNLVKKYANNLVVNGIDLTIYKGECFGLLGPNGAGKTSTLKMISCISPITSGELIIKGKSVSDDQLGVKSELGVVPQENNLDSDLTVLDNLLTYARYYDMNSSTALSRAWGATRSVLTATTILAFTYILGMVSSPWALLIIPVSFIIGLMFASIAITVTALVPSLNSLNNFFTLFVTPMWFFSGVFFPLNGLPIPITILAWFLPLTPASHLVRRLAFGELDWTLLASFLLMINFLAFFLFLALRVMRTRLIK